MVGKIAAVVVDAGSTLRLCGSGGAAPRWPPPAGACAMTSEPARPTMARAPTTCLKRIMLTPLTLWGVTSSFVSDALHYTTGPHWWRRWLRPLLTPCYIRQVLLKLGHPI